MLGALFEVLVGGGGGVAIKDYARGVAEECHRMWRRLRKVEREEATETNTSL